MPVLSALYTYPIKSCRGIVQGEASLTSIGLAWDRHWMVVDSDGRFVSQREYPSMARIVPMLTEADLLVHAANMPMLSVSLDIGCGRNLRQVTIWKDHLPALDEGDLAAQWFSEVIGVSVRLVRFDDAVQRRVSARWTGGDAAFTQFADGFPLLVTVQESLDELNARLLAKGAPALPMDRFRPNLVLSGLEAYDEDFLNTISIGADGAIVLRLVKPCARCPIPTIDQATGTRDSTWPNEPLDTMAVYRANRLVDGGLTFGQNAIVVHGEGQRLRTGTDLRYEWNFTENSSGAGVEG
ncbi:MOSC domain-containing protein [Paraburkholderia sp. BCC1885]|uniref:MOSC domain-containing protein n=1 Tax=Paraburkholderia sp. BCC1885 TaxID=2562669 RepID=UPI0011822F23|nr:MOSC N-terminal beta barrel domain-containing protein [Paraburkholderia sp. BCC1885]